VEEARETMLSAKNLLSPSSGEPIAAPTLDMVLGCYYVTLAKPEGKGAGRYFTDFDEAKLAYALGELDLHAEIYVREGPGKPVFKTTVGRIIFNEVLPPELRFRNEEMDKKALKQLVADCYRLLGNDRTAQMLDDLKTLGFRLATQAGISIAVADIRIPKEKSEIIARAEENIQKLEALYRRGLITEQERYEEAIRVWEEATEEITKKIEGQMDKWTSVYMMATSGAKGNIAQIRQMGGMRGLMSDPTGRIIDLPIVSNFREGLSVLEYFISTHGARKGLADTALRTADSGYLTRRLVDVAQDIIIREEDCGTNLGIWVARMPEEEMMVPFEERILGRYAALPVLHPETGEVIVEANHEIDEEAVEKIVRAGITQVYVRSPLTCQARYGLCRYCYGRDLARRKLVELGEAVGIIAAQSIGEPGTQLTMRTFHTGGIAQQDITTGLPRVEELFEARTPKNPAIVAEIDGVVDIIEEPGGVRKLKVVSSEVYPYELTVPPEYELVVTDGDYVSTGGIIARRRDVAEETLPALPDAVLSAPVDGTIQVMDGMVVINHEERDEREYEVPAQQVIRVEPGQRVKAGDQLTEGVVRPQDILRIQGREAVQLYLVREIQKVYRQQGVNINDKHIEVIVRQMLRKVQVESPGDTDLLPGELVDRFTYEEINARVLAEGGEPATAKTVLLGITKASLTTDSWLAAASFQETTRVLTEAAVKGAVDRLIGLKENVIIGRLIPAGTGFRARQLARLRQVEERLALGEAFRAFEGGLPLPDLDTASS
jgi:DNA-directed RNA polymerase subunit beta'